MTTMRLNSQVRQFGGFTPGKRVSGRTPKMPIDKVGNPHFGDFTNPVEASSTKTHHLIGVIQQIRQESLSSDFSGKLNLALRIEFGNPRMGGSFYANRFSPYRQIGRQGWKTTVMAGGGVVVNYWAFWQQIRTSSLSRGILRSWSRRHAFRKSVA